MEHLRLVPVEIPTPPPLQAQTSKSTFFLFFFLRLPFGNTSRICTRRSFCSASAQITLFDFAPTRLSTLWLFPPLHRFRSIREFLSWSNRNDHTSPPYHLWHLRGRVLRVIYLFSACNILWSHIFRRAGPVSGSTPHVHPDTRVQRTAHAIYAPPVALVTWITCPRYPWCIFSTMFPPEIYLNCRRNEHTWGNTGEQNQTPLRNNDGNSTPTILLMHQMDAHQK